MIKSICIAGKNKIAIEATRFLLDHYKSIEIVACVNKTDNGENNWQPSFIQFCKKNNIKIISLNEAYEMENSIFISLEYDQIVNPSKFQHSNIFNIHFSLLPAYKGMYTSVMPILNGEKSSGVTLHYIDAGIDTGDIIDQIEFSIPNEMNSSDIYNEYLKYGIELFKKNIYNIIKHDFNSKKQNLVNSSYYSKSAINFNAIEIDLNKTSYEIHNQIRAFAFREYQLPIVFDKKIYKSIILNDRPEGKAGTIFYENDFKIIINTIDSKVELYIDQLSKLLEAVHEEDISILEKIKNSNYPLNVRTKEGWDILIIAAYNHKTKIIEYLLDNFNWDINTCNYKGTNLLMYVMTIASRTDDLSILEKISKYKNLKWRWTDDKDRNVFSYAEEYGNTNVINFINTFL